METGKTKIYVQYYDEMNQKAGELDYKLTIDTPKNMDEYAKIKEKYDYLRGPFPYYAEIVLIQEYK